MKPMVLAFLTFLKLVANWRTICNKLSPMPLQMILGILGGASTAIGESLCASIKLMF